MAQTLSIAVCEADAALEIERLRKQPEVEVTTFYDRVYSPEDLTRFDVVIGWNDAVCTAVLRNNSHIRWLQTWSAGVDYLPLAALEERGVAITTASGANAQPIAQQVIGYMIAFVRNFPASARSQAQHIWGEFTGFTELTQKTVAVIGTGQIGSEIARLAHAFEMNVIGVNRSGHLAEGMDQVMCINQINEAAERADFVVSSLPLTQDTRHVINADVFSHMKPDAYYINVGRGKTTDQNALMEALHRYEIAGAALDVCEDEPLDPDSPLWDRDNVIITAHTAGYSDMYARRIISSFLTNLSAVHNDGVPREHVVDYSRGY